MGLAEQTGERGTARVGGYRVLRRLATGGTCDVLLAKAEGPHGFGRLVVLKLLLSKYSGDEAFSKMFAREAAAYARLDHPSIVRLYDFFSLDGQLVMVLEFVDGLTLSRIVSLARATNSEMPDAAAMYVGSRVFSAIAAAHSAKDPESGAIAPVIHRDVNPTNVLLPWDGHAKMTDFGIAKVAGITSDTQTGLIKGTYGYMAPEQVKGEVVTVRADVYAAAIVLWELFVKRPALMRDDLPEVELLRAMAEPRIASLDALRPDLDRRVRELMRVALEPDARKRLISASEIVSVLRAVSPGDEGREKLVALIERVRPGNERSVSPTPFVGIGGNPVASAMAAATPRVMSRELAKTAVSPGTITQKNGSATKPGATQVMPERPPLPRPEPPPRSSSTGSHAAVPHPGGTAAAGANAAGAHVVGAGPPPLPRPQQQSVSTMSAAIEAAVAAAIEAPAAPSELSQDALQSIPPGAPTAPPPPDGVLDGDRSGRVTEKQVGTPRAGLASLLEPSPQDFPAFGTPPATTSMMPPASPSTAPPTLEDGADEDEFPVDQTVSMNIAHMPSLGGRSADAVVDARGKKVDTESMKMRVGKATTERDLSAHTPPPRDAAGPAQAIITQAPPRAAQSTNPALSQGAETARPPKEKGGSTAIVVVAAVAVGLVIGLGAAAVKYRPGLLQAYLSPNRGGPATASVGASSAPPASGVLNAGAPSSIASAVPSSAGATASSAAATASSAAANASSAGTSALGATPSAVTSGRPSASAPSTSASSGMPPVPAVSSPNTHAVVASSASSAAAPAAPVTTSASATTAEIGTEAASAGHRIFVDGAVVGETPAVVPVACGKHTVKIGSAGKLQDVDVACGQRINVSDR